MLTLRTQPHFFTGTSSGYRNRKQGIATVRLGLYNFVYMQHAGQVQRNQLDEGQG